ncbi:MAG: hypothetical protein LBU89_10330 [Fibromonadaceae bacterium]|jgi:hypothetical protein|nr:hypothetical protein [Fibromonadaceae bacterium]
MQYDWWFRDIPGFADSLISNIKKADIVVSRMWHQIAPQANQILNEEFTKEQVKRYEIYFSY